MVFNATFNNISPVVVSFIGGGNWCSRRKPQTVLQVTDKTLSHKVVSITPCHK